MNKTILAMAFSMAIPLLSAEMLVEAESLIGDWRTESRGDASSGKFIYSVAKNNICAGKLVIPKSSDYYLWVRDISFGGNFRRADICIGEYTFQIGDSPNGLKKPNEAIWTRIPEPLKLEAGEKNIILTSHSEYCRIDAILLTDSAEYVPTNEIGENSGKAIRVDNASVPLLAKPNNIAGKKILLLCGGQPEIAKLTNEKLSSAGFAVTLVDSALLGEFGKTSGGEEATGQKDAVPEALHRITEFDAVMVTYMSDDNQKKFFNEERTSTIRKYVESGGTLIANFRSPNSIDDLLPVEGTDLSIYGKPDNWVVKMNTQDKELTHLPDEWRAMRLPSSVRTKPAASELISIVNNQISFPFLACWSFGKGRVYYINEDWEKRENIHEQLLDWAYGPALIGSILAHATKTGDAGISKLITASSSSNKPVAIDERISLRLGVPRADMTRIEEPCQIDDSTAQANITFANGVVVRVRKKKAGLSFIYPGIAQPVVTDLRPPLMEVRHNPANHVDRYSFETIPHRHVSPVYADRKWIVTGVKQAGANAVVHLSAGDDITAEWELRPGDFNLDDRKYNGIAEKFTITNSPLWVDSLCFKSKIRIGENLDKHMARRFSCYAIPRGYIECDFSSGRKDTSYWSWFGSGQPFTYMSAPGGIYVAFPDKPMFVSSSQHREQNDTYVTEEIDISIGLQRTPCGGEYIWHVCSNEPDAGKTNNSYLVWPQFIRTLMSSRLGIKQQIPLPTATHVEGIHANAFSNIVKNSESLGFKRYAIPEKTSMEQLGKQSEACQLLEKAGMKPIPFVAGNYTTPSEESFKHQDWFSYIPTSKWEYSTDNTLVNKKNFTYGGKTQVLDLNNAEFRTWHLGKIEEATRNGIAGLYIDMYGNAAGNVNYYKRPASPGIVGMQKIAQKLDELGLAVYIEGQNPLFLDSFLYRKNLYRRIAGKEFCLVGMCPKTSTPEDCLAIDFFRAAMYNCYPHVPIDGYVSKFERIPGEISSIRRVISYVPTCTMLAERIGVPFVRETPFGTSWIGENGAALFFWNAVKEIELDLPRGYRVSTITTKDGAINPISGNVLKYIPAESIVYIEKN